MAKILIIDDDADIVLAARLSLEGAGHQVVDAPNGTKGLELIKTEQPDLIILDVMMDSQTEGFQVALKLRSPAPTSEYGAFRHIPILMLTSIHSTTPLRFEPDMDYLPVDLFVDKPIDPDDLVQKVEWALTDEERMMNEGNI
jgi:two-component system alkaline phosphatase synthesis response regulator PhoP